MSISLTNAARTRVQGYLELDPTALGLRFGVSRSGCSGWGYKVEVARNACEGDMVFEDAGIRIYVDAASLSQVDGTCIDFVQQGLNSQFTFDNPNVTGGCGCGSSFTTDVEKMA
ncbi:MAG: iron-sulfur cluster assembly accessory protein [Xanthomonadaceae bacterium]|nr:iron-sulfur cluster assembly accessory protein [Xanthomonadaceae bacterium]